MNLFDASFTNNFGHGEEIADIDAMLAEYMLEGREQQEITILFDP